MSYSDFLSLVKTHVAMRLEGSPSIMIRPVLKNNGLKLDSLLILYPGENISPTIYLDRYYDAFQNGVSLEEICEEILSFYHAHRCPSNFDLSLIRDFRLAKDRIFLRLVNRNANPELLADFPHIPFLDLAILFCMTIHDGFLGDSTILIHKRHLALWDVTPEKLLPLALSNTRSQFGSLLTPLSSLIQRDPSEEIPPQLSSVHVLTNRPKSFGATCLLHEDVLLRFSREYGSFYVLPSSVHEAILVPERCQASPAFLLDTIRQVNETEVAPEEILSNHLYLYRASERKLGIVLFPGSVRFPLRQKS